MMKCICYFLLLISFFWVALPADASVCRNYQGSEICIVDIKDGKIWIQRNMTEVDIAGEFVKMGVSENDIVLGLHPPYKDPQTGLGVA